MVTGENELIKEEPKSSKRGKALDPYIKQQMMNVVSELYLKGYSYRQMSIRIPEVLNHTVSIPTIFGMVKKITKEWQAERITNMEELKTVELNKINKLEKTYWDSWQKSLTAKERRTDKQRAVAGKLKDAAGEIIPGMTVIGGEKSTTIEDNFGDPRFLDGVKWCITQRCKILGLEKPIEINATLTSNIRTKTVFQTRIRERPE